MKNFLALLLIPCLYAETSIPVTEIILNPGESAKIKLLTPIDTFWQYSVDKVGYININETTGEIINSEKENNPIKEESIFTITVITSGDTYLTFKNYSSKPTVDVANDINDIKEKPLEEKIYHIIIPIDN